MLSIVLNVLLFWQYVVSGRVVWGETTYDAKGRKHSTASYRPYALFPFETIVYDKTGATVSVWRDSDSDGWNESVDEFVGGERFARSIDRDSNGVMDMTHHFGPSGETIATTSDEDRDGRFDTYRCTPGPHGPLFDVAQCRDGAVPAPP